MKDKGIILFTRIPVQGKTKTRLEPFLGKDLCVKLQTAFLKDIYTSVKETGIDIIVNYSEDGSLKILKDILGEDQFFLRQNGDGLGEKMHKGISFALKQYKQVVLIGSDLPLIKRQDIEVAFKILATKDIVISPTFDGGYYLIGMSEENKEIFDLQYSREDVFEETIGKIGSIGKTFGTGNIQFDIDTKSDLIGLYEILKESEEVSCPNTRKIVYKIMEECGVYEGN